MALISKYIKVFVLHLSGTNMDTSVAAVCDVFFFSFVFFPSSLDRYKSIFVKLLDMSFVLERFT